MDGAMAMGEEVEGSIVWLTPQQLFQFQLEETIKSMIKNRNWNLEERAEKMAKKQRDRMEKFYEKKLRR